MRHELFVYALHTPGLEDEARRQIDGYTRIVAEWIQKAASTAGEVCAVPFDTLARVSSAVSCGSSCSTSATTTGPGHNGTCTPSPRC